MKLSIVTRNLKNKYTSFLILNIIFMEEKMFIGRTTAYYEENNNCFCERTWVVSDNPYDEQFADNVYEMSEEAINEYEWWANCRLKNEWELSYTFNPDMRCSEAIFDSIVKKSKIYEI